MKSGEYQNASEVVRDVLRLHAFNRQRMLVELRVEIELGWNSPVSSKLVKDNVDEMHDEVF